MGRVIAAGHICLDITPVFPGGQRTEQIGDLLIPGKLIQVDAASVHTGGSVANTGLALKLLGNDVTLLGKVGSDAFGGLVQKISSEYGAGGLIVDEGGSTSYTVVLAAPGIDRIFLHNPGANDTFSAADIPEEALQDAALFHFGYPPLMKRMYAEDGRELEALLRRVKDHSIATSLDLAAMDAASEAGRADWQTILSRVLPYVDFFVPSFEELCFMLDRPRYEELAAQGGDMTLRREILRDADRLAEACLRMGCAAALIKCGLSGMVYRVGDRDRLSRVNLDFDRDRWANRAGFQPCFRADAVRSATGAGDVSIAAWLIALLRGETPEACARLAAAEGAASVTSYDALGGVLPLDALKKRLAAGWETL